MMVLASWDCGEDIQRLHELGLVESSIAEVLEVSLVERDGQVYLDVDIDLEGAHHCGCISVRLSAVMVVAFIHQLPEDMRPDFRHQELQWLWSLVGQMEQEED